jgi:hypothetical protein
VAIAYLQEFVIQDGDTSTTNYDAVVAALNLQDAPDGLLIHTAGFDHDAGVFRIFDVWETREQGEKFINERLNPIIEPMAAEAARTRKATSLRRLARPGTSCTIDDRLTGSRRLHQHHFPSGGVRPRSVGVFDQPTQVIPVALEPVEWRFGGCGADVSSQRTRSPRVS